MSFIRSCSFWFLFGVIMTWTSYSLARTIHSQEIRSTRRNEDKELAPSNSFCPSCSSVVIWKACPHLTLGNCTEGFLSAPSSHAHRRLNLRSPKDGLRSNEIFTFEKSQKTALGDPYALRRFYGLKTSDNRCVQADDNGYLTVGKHSDNSSCTTLFRDFFTSNGLLTASPKRICVLSEGDKSAFVLKFDSQGNQIPLRVDSPTNCSRVNHSHSSTCESGYYKDLKITDLLGLSKNDYQGTAFKRLFVHDLVREGGVCSEIFSEDVLMDCCNLLSEC